jgi:hypothetical protein
MADFFQTIIDTRVEAGEADHLARHVVSFLADRDIIARDPSEEGGYSRGPRALEISDVPPRRAAHETIPPVFSHLQVIIGRTIHSGDLSESRPPRARCPRCGLALDDPDDEWRAAVQAWLGGDDASSLGCPGCGAAAPVSEWEYDAQYGFGNLAFRFWNWPPLTSAFLEDLRKELGHPISLVRGKL